VEVDLHQRHLERIHCPSIEMDSPTQLHWTGTDLLHCLFDSPVVVVIAWRRFFAKAAARFPSVRACKTTAPILTTAGLSCVDVFCGTLTWSKSGPGVSSLKAIEAALQRTAREIRARESEFPPAIIVAPLLLGGPRLDSVGVCSEGLKFVVLETCSAFNLFSLFSLARSSDMVRNASKHFQSCSTGKVQSSTFLTSIASSSSLSVLLDDVA